MSRNVFQALACGSALLFLGCQNTTSTITPGTSPVSIACDTKQAGGRFTSCAAPIAQSAQRVAIGGDAHVGQRFAVNGSFEGVLR
jgi:hypothetical protein